MISRRVVYSPHVDERNRVNVFLLKGLREALLHKDDNILLVFPVEKKETAMTIYGYISLLLSMIRDKYIIRANIGTDRVDIVLKYDGDCNHNIDTVIIEGQTYIYGEVVYEYYKMRDNLVSNRYVQEYGLAEGEELIFADGEPNFDIALSLIKDGENISGKFSANIDGHGVIKSKPRIT